MKNFACLLVLMMYCLACQSRQKKSTDGETIAQDTTIVDDDTLETSAARDTFNTSIKAVATLPDAAEPVASSTGANPTDFFIIPGQQAGPITATATEASLIQLLGQNNVTHEAIELGEGDSEPGTTLFKGTANEVHIIWKDKKRFARPDAVLIQPVQDETPTANVVPSWVVNNGIQIGSTLKAVEKINGRPFKLYGFGWDMGGSLSDAQGGNLRDSDGKSYLSLTFGPGPQTAAQEKILDMVSGDSEFLSSTPAMQIINPKIESIQIRFRN